MRVRPNAIALALAALACWQIGDGLWIFAKAKFAQYLIAEAWQRSLAAGSRTKPWPWADTWPVARLQVAAQEIDLYILDGANGGSLAFGPGHVRGSAPPGTEGVTVVGGHRDTHFRFLQQLATGDKIMVTSLHGRQRFYRVADKRVVHINRLPLRVTHKQSGLLLITCYPFDTLRPGGPLRYLVSAVEDHWQRDGVSGPVDTSL